jgi:hypothetical protein
MLRRGHPRYAIPLPRRRRGPRADRARRPGVGGNHCGGPGDTVVFDASDLIAAGRTRTLTLHASRPPRGRITHPVVIVRNADTGGAVTLRPHA